MKYYVMGAGGVGASLAGYMTEGKQDVTLIARGANLNAIQERGLVLTPAGEPAKTIPVSVKSAAELTEELRNNGKYPDCIFVCTKYYSLKGAIPELKGLCGPETILIPLLNVYGTGEEMQPFFPDNLVTDGCIYIAAYQSGIGEITMTGKIFRVVYGVREPEKITQEQAKKLFQIREDLKNSGISPVLAENIRRDCLQKFSMVSPMAGAGIYYDTNAGGMQEAGEPREFYKAMVREIDEIAQRLEIPFLCDIVKTNLDILDACAPSATASLQKDYFAGGDSEAEGLILRPIRLGESLGADMSHYRMVAEKMGLLK